MQSGLATYEWGSSRLDLLTYPRFCYYCEDCLSIALVSNALIRLEHVKQSFNERCPDCNQPLKLSFRKFHLPLASEFWLHPKCKNNFLQIRSERRKSNRAVFQRASELFNIDSGISRFDDLVGRIEPGNFVVLHGSRHCLALSELLGLRAQTASRFSRNRSYSIFIDAGNSFDPYLLAEFAKQQNIDPKLALQHIIISRPFTIYQLAALVLKELPKTIAQFNPKLVVVSDLLQLFNDPALDAEESQKLVKEIVDFFRSIARDEGIITMATCFRDSLPFTSLLFDSSDILLKVEEGRGKVRATLEHHPFIQSTSVSFKFEQDTTAAKALTYQHVMRNG